MHKAQRAILELLSSGPLVDTTLREIGEKISVGHPYSVSRHLESLRKSGLLEVVKGNRGIKKVSLVSSSGSGSLVRIPIYGDVSCGPATCFADDRVEGYLSVSPSVLNGKSVESLYAIRAVGNSMDESEVLGGPINPGDFVIVDKGDSSVKDGDYIVSVLDGCANVKRIKKNGDLLALVSESSTPKDFPPIFIHPDDDFVISGKVFRVISNPIAEDV